MTKTKVKQFFLRLAAGTIVLALCFFLGGSILALMEDKTCFQQEWSILMGLALGGLVAGVGVILFALSVFLPRQAVKQEACAGINGPLVWQQCKRCNHLLHADSDTYQSVDFNDHGLLLISRWQRDSREGLQFRIKASDIALISTDTENSLVLIKTFAAGGIQGMTFTAQDADWDGDYGFASGQSNTVGLKVQDPKRLNIVCSALRSLVKELNRPARTFAELPSYW